ncbi:MAG: hypothetical protein LBG58_12125 [Planctomycetaceae bacterium]|jgi:hypothetical protein|nr:hypothetical protein [Planctomycetaceae bacterium]
MPTTYINGGNFAVGEHGELLLSETGIIHHYEFIGGSRIPVDQAGRIVVSLEGGGDDVAELFIFVAELPEEGLPHKIYFVPATDSSGSNQFDEYAWIDGVWEHIGKISVTTDLSDYYTKTETDTKYSAKSDVYTKTETYSKTEIDTNIYTKTETYTKNQVESVASSAAAAAIAVAMPAPVTNSLYAVDPQGSITLVPNNVPNCTSNGSQYKGVRFAKFGWGGTVGLGKWEQLYHGENSGNAGNVICIKIMTISPTPKQHYAEWDIVISNTITEGVFTILSCTVNQSRGVRGTIIHIPEIIVSQDGDFFDVWIKVKAIWLWGAFVASDEVSENDTLVTPITAVDEQPTAIVETQYVGDGYYTVEYQTGKYWTDGKPIYRRVLSGNIVVSANTTTSIALLSSGVDTLVDSGGWLMSGLSTSQVSLGQYYETVDVTFSSCIVNSNNNAVLFSKSSLARTGTTNNAYKVWVEYTKTT